MNKLIILLTLVAVSFSVDKWEYARGEYRDIAGELQFFKVYIFDTRLNMAKIQYTSDSETIEKINKKHMIDKGLQEMGNDGWELVNIVKDFTSTSEKTHLYFKRRIEDD